MRYLLLLLLLPSGCLGPPPASAPDAAGLGIDAGGGFGKEDRGGNPDAGAHLDAPPSPGDPATGRCLRVTPRDVEFPPGRLGVRATAQVVLESCGEEPAALLGVRLVDGSSWAFSIGAVPEGLDRACLQERRSACRGRVELAPGARANVVVRYTPSDRHAQGGRLRLETDVPGTPHLDVHLFGPGPGGDTPGCLAEARLADDDDWRAYPSPERPLAARPLDTLALRPGQGRTGGRPTNPRWSVLERPEGSRARLDPGPYSPVVNFRLDLSGRYLFGLEVTGADGTPATCEVHVEACCGVGGIRVELTWDTPAAEAEEPAADLDLHLRREPAGWFCEADDCWAANPAPGWGATFERRLGGRRPDPGPPESIALPEAEEGGVYRIGVHYVNDHGHGRSFATVQVYVAGVLVVEHAGKPLARAGAFWEVAELHGSDGRVVPLDLRHATPPEPFCRE